MARHAKYLRALIYLSELLFPNRHKCVQKFVLARKKSQIEGKTSHAVLQHIFNAFLTQCNAMEKFSS